MYDHVMMFTDEAAARTALAVYGQDDAGHWQWDQNRVIPDQRVVLARAVWDHGNPDAPVLISPEVTVPGYFVTVTLAAIEPSLRDMAGHSCRVIGIRESGDIVYTAPDLDMGLLVGAIVEPMPAGAAYLFAAPG